MTVPQPILSVAEDNRRTLERALADSHAAVSSSRRQPASDTADRLERHAVVLRALGVDVDSATAPIEILLRQRGIRSRPVRLEPGWQGKTQTAMVGWRLDGEPVALIPRGGNRGYTVSDGGPSRPLRATSPLAPPLREDALALYPKLTGNGAAGPRLLRLALLGSARDVVQFLVAGVLFGLLALAVPVSVGTVVPQLLAGGSTQLWWVAVLLGGVTLLAGAALLVRNATALRLQGRIQAVLEPAVWDRMLGQDVSFFRRYSTGDLVQRGNAIAQVRRVLSEVVVGAALNAFFSLTSIVVVLIVAPALGLLLAGAAIVFAVTLVLLARRQSRHEAVVYDTFGEVFGLLYAVLLGIDKIQAAGREVQVFARWARVFRRQKLADSAALREQAGTTALAAGLQPLLIAVLLSGVVLCGLRPSVPGVMIAGLAIGQVAMAVGQLAQLAASAYGVAPMLQRLQPILAEPVVRGGNRAPGRLDGAVALDAVSFSYPASTEPTLDSVTLTAAPGEFVAIVGPSGAGKSTILRLLLGFEAATTGTVRYSSTAIEELDLRLLRAQLGTVLQHGTMLRGSVFDNIAGPASQTSVEDVWHAAELAGVAGDLRALPMGLDTRVNETAQGLSGGQVQRLLLARALVRRPAVLLLDEATSALDNRTQHEISERIAALKCTRIVIAHRLSTVRHADRIYVVDGGRVENVGSHDELQRSSPLYANLVRRQEVPA